MAVSRRSSRGALSKVCEWVLRRARPVGRSCAIEALEDRRLLAGTPYISEFLASNDTGLADEDGSTPDWIEIANPTAGSINLDGYYLTDSPGNLTQWRLPAVTLDAGAHLVVFASGKDRAVAGSELHANFSIDDAGEYLALVDPDGATILSQYATPYPAQVRDVSYGISTTVSATTLIGPAAPVRVHVPTSSSLGTSWMLPGFGDSSWIGGTSGVGFDYENTPIAKSGFTVRMLDVNNGIGDITTARNALNGVGLWTILSDTTADSLAINYGSGGDFGGDLTYSNGTYTIDTVAIRATANVFIPAGTWTFNVKSDDGFMLKIPNVSFSNRINENYTSTGWTALTVPADTLVYGTGRGGAHTSGSVTIPAGGLTTTITLEYYENGGGDLLEFSIGSGSTAFGGSFVLAGDGAMAGWQVKTSSSAPAPNYNPIIGTGISSSMRDKNASAYIRIPVSALVVPSDFDKLRLNIKYDDGFVAYLNGHEIARRNAPATPAWNSSATAAHPDAAAMVYEQIDIDLPAGWLLPGANANVLAIHGLNLSAADLDFLVYAEMKGLHTVESKATYFTVPTPGAANAVSSTTEVVADTKFSHDRGFYSSPFQVTITTATQGAQIRYTLDGSTPTATTGTVYSGPVAITGTSVLRAGAFKAGAISANVDTQTYLFTSDVVLQSPDGAAPAGWPASWSPNTTDYGMDPDVVNNPLYSNMQAALLALPTFSVVTDQANLFGATGIYSNPSWDGRTAERPASIELIYPDGADGFQIDAGLRLRGGFSRSTDNPKHGLRVILRGEYGAGELEYPLFGDGVDVFDGFDLRTFQNYSWSFQGSNQGIFVRDQFSRDVQLAMGQPGSRGDYYHLYINGQYWGIYNTDERPEANYAANQFGGDPDDYDVIKVAPDDGYIIYATDGNMAAWTDLWTQALGDLSNDANYLRMQGLNPDGTRNPAYPVLLDVDNLIDYMLVIFYGGNLDAPLSSFLGNDQPNNFFAIRNRESNDQGFQFIVHDAEHTLLNAAEDRTGPWNTYDAVNPATSLKYSNPQFLFEQLCENEEFRLQVADRVHKWFFNDGPMKKENALALFNSLIAELYLPVIAESARWGDAKRATPLTRDVEWIGQVNNVRNNYFPYRTANVLSQLTADSLYPTLDAPEFSQFGGSFNSVLNLAITNPDSTGVIYYTLDGTDPRLWGGAVRGGALTYTTGPVVLTGAKTVTARIYYAATDTWSAITQASFHHNLSPVRFTEVMYNPAPDDGQTSTAAQAYEFIEIQNFGTSQLDLSGVKVEGIGYTFPAGAAIAAGQRLVLAKSPLLFAQRYPGISVFDAYSGTLDNNEEELALEYPDGTTAIELEYSDAWFPITDSGGFSLVAIDPQAAVDAYGKKSNWRPSNPVGGAPGAADAGYAPESIVINEVLTNTLGGVGDWVELHNTTAQPIDISGWFLSDDPATPMKYQIQPGSIIPAGGFLVLTQAAHFGNVNDPGMRVLFGFSWLGDEVVLRSSDTLTTAGGYEDRIDFAAAAMDVPFGRYVKATGGKDIVPMSAPTMGYANALPAVGPVVISEIMYNPLAGEEEFLELYNMTASPYLLYDPADPLARWGLIEGVEYTFKAGEEIGPLSYALVVGIEPALFRARYAIPASVPVFGPWVGSLNNSGETLKLGHYAGTTAGGEERYTTIDQVDYSDHGAWPAAPDGNGPSLMRIIASGYGNDATNWAASPTPGGTPGGTVSAPPAPTQLTGKGIGGPRIQLFWVHTSPNEEGFIIERSANGTTFAQVGVAPANATMFEDTAGLTAGVFYTYRVRAYNAMGNSTWSNLMSVVAPAVQTVDLVSYTSAWRYNEVLVTQPSLPSNWMTSSYSDNVAGWNNGTGLFHRENYWDSNPPPAPKGTMLNLVSGTTRIRSHYFRTTFTLNANPADIGSLQLWIIVDDGAVVYLNGTQVFSIGMAAGPYNSLSFSNRNVDNARIEGPYLIPAASLVQGQNILAVEVHQSNDTTTDVAFGCMLQSVITPVTVSAAIAGVTPSPSIDPISTMTVTFTEPVTGFGLPDLRLTRDGGANLLTGQETLTTSDGGKTWTLGNLAPLTGISGRYTLTLTANGSGIAGQSIGSILGSDAIGEFRITGTTLGGQSTLYVRRNVDYIEVFTAVPQGQAPLLILRADDLQALTINGTSGNDLLQVVSALPAAPGFFGYAGDDRLEVSAGQYVFAGDLASAGVETLVASGSALVRFEATQHLDALHLSGQASAIVTAGGDKVLHLGELTIGDIATLNIADNMLAVMADEASLQQVSLALSAMIRSARNGGNWSGPGLTSSVAAMDEQELTTVAVIPFEDIASALPPEAAAPGLLIVRYALYGDANLDGAVTGADYFRLDSGYLAGLLGYASGDFDHSGSIDGDDYYLADRGYLMQSVVAAGAPAPSAPPIAAEPPASESAAEPAWAADGDVLTGLAVPVVPSAPVSPFAGTLKIGDNADVWEEEASLLA